MNLLKQSTAAILKLGPFVDDGDFKTLETSLTIAQGDIQISKSGGAFAQTSEGSPATTHDADGWYPIPLTATDTGTLGRLTVQVHASGALPVWWEGLVVPAAVYDSLVLGTDYLPADAVQIEGGDATDALAAAVSAYDAPTKAELDSAFAEIKGATWAADTDTLEHIRDKAGDIETDTQDLQTQVGVAGVGLSNLGDTRLANLDATVSSRLADADYTAPDSAATIASAVAAALNDLDATDVQTAVNAALVALHLDHLLAVTYDPASKPGAADALLNELVESDGGVTRFTANALEQGPSSSGGDATEAKQDAILASLADAKGATFDTATDSLEAIRNRGDAAWLSGAGEGAITYTYTLTSSVGGTPIDDALVEVYTEAAMTNKVAQGRTDAFGVVTFYLDAGTYYLKRSKGGWSFTNPQTATVAP